MKSLVWLLFALSLCTLQAEPRTVRVFVALADNASQGIVPVPPKIGDGNVPEENLYWGCTDGLKSIFKASSKWKLTKKETNVSDVILERLQFTHTSGNLVLVANAYRGSAIRQCIQDFESCLAEGKDDLVVYIGHDGLMEFDPPLPAQHSPRASDAIVLCCSSRTFFQSRLEKIGAHPVLLTDQLMYPGAFVLHDAIEAWRIGGSLPEIRQAAAKAYAKNQGISVKSAQGVFRAF